MLQASTRPFLGALAVALCSPVSAGSPQETLPLNEVQSVESGLLLDEPGDGLIWARGPGWKASFGPWGMTYIPFFGSDALQNYPVRLDLTRATVAQKPLELSPRACSTGERTVTLDRGALAEVYHLTKDTVEQTFVFHSVPGPGEIVLDISMETELQARPRSDGGIDFFNELGRVHYGRALAVDAAGRSLELSQELTESGVRIVVPAEYVAVAQWPLVVDPILTTFPVTTNSRRQLEVDVAYEDQNSNYQIVYAEVQSALDIDVIAVRYSTALGLAFSPSSIDISSASWSLPCNASNYHEQQFLCAAVVGNSVGSRRVWGRTMASGSGARGAQFQISGPGAEAVDVGGKGNDINSSFDYMVVWQEADTINQDFDIVAQAVSGNSALTFGRIIIDGDVGDLDRAPAISKTSGRRDHGNSINEYMIVWEREISPTNRNLRAQVIEYTGAMTGHSQFNAYTFSDSRAPDVSSRGIFYSYSFAPHWVIAFERLIGSDYDIFAVVARDGFADNARNLNVMQNLDLDRDHRDPVIGSDGQDHHIAYQTESPNGDRSIHVTSVNIVHDDGELRVASTLRRETLALSEGSPGHIGLASLRDGGALAGAGPGNVLVAWSATDSGTGNSNVGAAVYEDAEILSLGSQYCEAALNSSGTSAWMAVRGMNWTVPAGLILDATEMPLQSFGHFLVSNAAGFTVNPGGSQGNLCLQGSVGRFDRSGEIMNSGNLGSIELTVDATMLPGPNGVFSAVPGDTFYFQCWFRDLGPSSNFTNAVEMIFE